MDVSLGEITKTGSDKLENMFCQCQCNVLTRQLSEWLMEYDYLLHPVIKSMKKFTNFGYLNAKIVREAKECYFITICFASITIGHKLL